MTGAASQLSPPLAPGVDGALFRETLGRFATGVAFVTAIDGDTPHGLIVSSVASVSLQPPLVSFSPSRDSLTWSRMRRTGRFGVNVLGPQHEEFVRRAAAPGADRFAGIEWRPAASGVPRLADAVAFIDCAIEAEHPAGDHWIVVGRVEEAHVDHEASPLVYWASGFGSFSGVPSPDADRPRPVTGDREAAGSGRALATVLFTDIVGSTRRAAQLGDLSWRTLLERHDTLVRAGVERHGGRLVKSLGDGALATFDHPSRAIGAATAIRDSVRALDLDVRSGVHTGEFELLPRGDIAGIAVHIGARIGALARAGEVLVSSTVRDLIAGSGRTLADRGEHELKDVPGRWRVFAVQS